MIGKKLNSLMQSRKFLISCAVLVTIILGLEGALIYSSLQSRSSNSWGSATSTNDDIKNSEPKPKPKPKPKPSTTTTQGGAAEQQNESPGTNTGSSSFVEYSESKCKEEVIPYTTEYETSPYMYADESEVTLDGSDGIYVTCGPDSTGYVPEPYYKKTMYPKIITSGTKTRQSPASTGISLSAAQSNCRILAGNSSAYDQCLAAYGY